MIQEQNNPLPELFSFRGPKLEECDLPRLNTAARRVWDWMMEAAKYHEGWCDLNEIANTLGLPHSTVTACVRGFRNDENGGHTVQTKRRKAGKGTWLYKLEPNTREGIMQARERAAYGRTHGTAAHRQGATNGLLDLKNWIIEFNNKKGGWWLREDGKEILAKIDEMVKGLGDA